MRSNAVQPSSLVCASVRECPPTALTVQDRTSKRSPEREPFRLVAYIFMSAIMRTPIAIANAPTIAAARTLWRSSRSP
jgi:hypothetical protein